MKQQVQEHVRITGSKDFVGSLLFGTLTREQTMHSMRLFAEVPEVQAAGFHVFSKLNDQVVTIYMQQQWDPVPVSDKRVRQVLNLAIDKEAIMQHVFAGQGVPVAMYPIGSYGVAGGADPELEP